jgi:hypothetical protein
VRAITRCAGRILLVWDPRFDVQPPMMFMV